MEALDTLTRLAETLAARASDSASSGTPVGADWLAGACRELARVSDSWPGYFGGDPVQRTYHLLARSEQLEAWLIWWPQGGRLRLHDHGGSAGAFGVVDGTLEETYLRLSQDRAPHPAASAQLRRRTITRGDVEALETDHVHDVINPHQAGATSVHLYSPPSETLAFYRHDNLLGLVPDSESVSVLV